MVDHETIPELEQLAEAEERAAARRREEDDRLIATIQHYHSRGVPFRKIRTRLHIGQEKLYSLLDAARARGMDI
jgi:hypothetical protein